MTAGSDARKPRRHGVRLGVHPEPESCRRWAPTSASPAVTRASTNRFGSGRAVAKNSFYNRDDDMIGADSGCLLHDPKLAVRGPCPGIRLGSRAIP
jgi:hypothetical protein